MVPVETAFDLQVEDVFETGRAQFAPGSVEPVAQQQRLAAREQVYRFELLDELAIWHGRLC